jgi:hypothetical protein
VAEYTVYGGVTPILFSGELLAEVRTNDDQGAGRRAVRWLEMELYRRTDMPGAYLLHTIGCSDVYHRVDGCRRGVPLPAARLPEDTAVPCRRCNPLPLADLVAADESVRAETDRHTTWEALEPAALPAKLRNPALHDQGTGLTWPAHQLLEIAMEKDEVLREILQTPKRTSPEDALDGNSLRDAS